MLEQHQHQQVIDLCRQLVQAPSLAGREQDAATIAATWMQTLGYDHVETDTYGSVIGRIQGDTGAGPTLHFDGHLDTVPATALDQWTHAPYGADIDAEHIWGRGSTDMKGPVAAMLCAAAFVPRERLRGAITVSASVAEEELEGAALQAILTRYPADLVVIGEATMLQVGIGHKGRAGIRITTHGRPAHSAVPHAGDNAVYRMIAATQALRVLALPDDAMLGPAVMELVEFVSHPYPGTSIVPDRCTVRWDRRLVRGETRESVLAHINAALAAVDGYAAGKVTAEYLAVGVPCYTGATLTKSQDFHPAWEIGENSALVQAALASTAAAGIAPATRSVPYCTNGSGSAGELGIPSIILGPGDPAHLHIIDERIAIDQLVRGTVDLYGAD
ncbi:MAG: YgeY family selenium metabolism-linked hydrolase [Chloroflexaceae bacterium]|nr:YgeY family selenium metabolism-linked hydrolase [Chloroflexaceae bacterium]